MTKKTLQSSKQIVMEAILAFQKRNHRMPTSYDILYMTPLQTTAHVCYVLKRLETLGAIKRDGEKWHTMKIIDAKKVGTGREFKRYNATGEETRLGAVKMARTLEERMDDVVKRAKEREAKSTGEDVFFERHGLIRGGRLRGAKI